MLSSAWPSALDSKKHKMLRMKLSLHVYYHRVKVSTLQLSSKKKEEINSVRFSPVFRFCHTGPSCE